MWDCDVNYKQMLETLMLKYWVQTSAIELYENDILQFKRMLTIWSTRCGVVPG